MGPGRAFGAPGQSGCGAQIGYPLRGEWEEIAPPFSLWSLELRALRTQGEGVGVAAAGGPAGLGALGARAPPEILSSLVSRVEYLVQVTKAGLRAGPAQHADLQEVWSIMASSRRGLLLPRPRIGECLIRMAVRGGPGRVAAAREAAPPAVLRQPLQRAVMGPSSSERHASRVPGAVHPRRACVRRF